MRLDSVVFAVAAFGLTLSTIVSGPQTLMYYGFVVVFFLPLISWNHFTLAFSRASVITALIPLLLYFLQASLTDVVPSWPGFLRQSAISVVLFLTCWLARIDDTCRRQFFTHVAVAHGLLAFIGYWQWSPSMDWQRLATFGLGPAPWAEFSLAAILAAICTGNRGIVIFCAALATPNLIGTQMRASYVSLAIALVIFFYPTFRRLAAGIRAIVVVGIVVLGAVFFEDILQGLSDALLMDDPHRGLESGFSGRFDNWKYAFNVFRDHPLLGAGNEHPIAIRGHNAFLKIAAEQGIFAFILMISAIILAFIYAWSRRDSVSIAVISGWLLFMMTAPRYISFSILIFLGWVVVMRQLFWTGKAQTSRDHTLVNQPPVAVRARQHGTIQPP